MATHTSQELLNRTIENCSERMACWKGTLTAFPSLFWNLKDLEVEPYFNLSDGYIDISVYGDLPRLKAIWRELRTSGYKPDSQVPEEPVATFSTFWRPIDSRYATIWFRFSSSVCKMVQVGTETIERPIYKVQCTDGREATGQ